MAAQKRAHMLRVFQQPPEAGAPPRPPRTSEPPEAKSPLPPPPHTPAPPEVAQLAPLPSRAPAPSEAASPPRGSSTPPREQTVTPADEAGGLTLNQLPEIAERVRNALRNIEGDVCNSHLRIVTGNYGVTVYRPHECLPPTPATTTTSRIATTTPVATTTATAPSTHQLG
ncbi:PREDICTED: mucin-7-like [Rhagoletis zephyria]|uniref:mucin-7-like n=1 Tax=Rhagoletis zephyria TaxID=28612 RepID=UPI0008112EDD|nr:PREDICTED: mucin-7-like [Rhagoletis zephyria]